MPDPTLNLSDNLNNWTDAASKVVGLTKVLSDSGSANWVDAAGPVEGVRFSQGPVEILSGSVGNVNFSQGPVEIVAPTNGLLQLILSDSFTLTDKLALGKGIAVLDSFTMADSVLVVPSAPLTLVLSDSLNNWLDSLVKIETATIQLVLSDSLNNWLDSVSTLLAVPRVLMTQEPVELFSHSSSTVKFSQGPVEIAVPTSGLIQLVLSDSLNNWLDSLAKAFPKVIVASDSLTMTDSVVIALTAPLSLNLSDSWNTWLDSVVFVNNTFLALSLTVSDAWNSWLDLVQTATQTEVAINLVLSDSMNFWQDPNTFPIPPAPPFVTPLIDTSKPHGNPNDNCCPPNIWISD